MLGQIGDVEARDSVGARLSPCDASLVSSTLSHALRNLIAMYLPIYTMSTVLMQGLAMLTCLSLFLDPLCSRRCMAALAATTAMARRRNLQPLPIFFACAHFSSLQSR